MHRNADVSRKGALWWDQEEVEEEEEEEEQEEEEDNAYAAMLTAFRQQTTMRQQSAPLTQQSPSIHSKTKGKFNFANPPVSPSWELQSIHSNTAAQISDASVSGEVACQCHCHSLGKQCAAVRLCEEEIRRLNEEMVAQLDDAMLIQHSQDDRVEELVRQVAEMKRELANQESERATQDHSAHRHQQLLESRLLAAEHKAAVLEKEAERWRRKAEAQSHIVAQQSQTMAEGVAWQLQETIASLESREASLLERFSTLTDELDSAHEEANRLKEQLQAAQQRYQAAEAVRRSTMDALASAHEQAAAEGKAYLQCLVENGMLKAEIAILQRRLEKVEPGRREADASTGSRFINGDSKGPLPASSNGLVQDGRMSVSSLRLRCPNPVAQLTDFADTPKYSQGNHVAATSQVTRPDSAPPSSSGVEVEAPRSVVCHSVPQPASPAASATDWNHSAQPSLIPIPASPPSRPPFATERTVKHAQSTAALERRLMTLNLQRKQDEAELSRLLEARGPTAKSSAARQRRAELEQTLAASEREVNALRLQLRTLGYL
eukprot:GGOE01023442.1.p1 GENE.GGOE01023442.1~~GGOE01023442.1.p1  ORF type:complete len:548 (+),score=127.95 GGOE01023442.1:410-2053(+)